MRRLEIVFKDVEIVTTSDPFVRRIIKEYKSQREYDQNVFYDMMSKMIAVEEAKQILSAIFEGNQLRVKYKLKDNTDVNILIINIFNLYCPVTKEHGKMKCTNFKIEKKGKDQFLKVTYKCMHPKCRAERFINEYLPKLWDQAKTVVPDLIFANLKLS